VIQKLSYRVINVTKMYSWVTNNTKKISCE
jgi:hypothetical protein